MASGERLKDIRPQPGGERLKDVRPQPGGERLKDVRPQPGICKLLHGLEDLNLVDSKFGLVPFGSVLSYQCPPEISRDIVENT
ncbi:hypothetical protein UPYG_G00037930 [Umbra pygmaea]|uniref:Uncharacterized protein n=1 Tax=Umbra pygmaea TaxID=75934 RepID=A0ABD0XPD9_UMBPY